MYIPFNELPNSSRVWVYQSDRAFANNELEQISELLKNFINGWNNHGDGLKSSFTIKHNQFIILAIDEDYRDASGCSIDSSVQIIKKIENAFSVNLFDRMKTAFKIDNNINIVSLADFQNFVNEGKINHDTIVFNNMIKTIEDFKSKWEVKAENSWHKRYF